jgi:hypothetical protein
MSTRIDAIDSTEEGANTIANRLASVEDEIEEAHLITGEDEETGDPIRTGTLNDRFNSIDQDIIDINVAID